MSLHIPSVAGSRRGQTVDLGETPACIQCGPYVFPTLPTSIFDPVWGPKMLLPTGCPSPSVLGASTQGHPATPYATRRLSSSGCGRALGCRDKDEKDAGVPSFRGNQALPASWPRDTYLTLHIAVKCLLASSTFGQAFFP